VGIKSCEEFWEMVTVLRAGFEVWHSPVRMETEGQASFFSGACTFGSFSSCEPVKADTTAIREKETREFMFADRLQEKKR